MSGRKDSGSFYESLQDAYYDFAESLENSGIPFSKLFVEPIENAGIPSLPVFALLVLALLGSALYFLLPYFQPSSSLHVSVLSSGQAIDGALVQISGGGISKTALSKNGEALFSGLPSGTSFRITVSKEGFVNSVKTAVAGKTDSVDILLLPKLETVSVSLSVSDSEGNPIAASVFYSYPLSSGGTVSKTVPSSDKGEALLSAESGALVYAKISADGYETTSDSFLAEKDAKKSFVLKKTGTGTGKIITGTGVTENTFSNSESASVSVSLKDEKGNAVDANVKIFDVSTYDLLNESGTDFGSAYFSGLAVGTSVKVSAESSNYEKTSQSLTLKKTNSVSLVLKKKTSSDKIEKISKISVIDEQGKAIEAGITVLDSEFSVIKEAQDSELSLNLSAKALFYATASKDGFLPSKSSKFKGGESAKIILKKATASNSVNLTINVFDEDGRKITSPVSVAFFDSENDKVPPFSLKTLNGKLSLQDFPKGTFTIAASNPPRAGNVTAELSSDSEINVTLLNPKGILSVSAADFDNSTIDSFSAYAYYLGSHNDTLLSSCSAVSGTCDLEFRSDLTFRIIVSSANYDNFTASKKVPANNITLLSATLIHLSSNSVSKIRFKSFEDEDGNPVSEPVADKYYLATFDLFVRNTAEKGAVFLKLSDENGAPAANVVNYSYSEIPDSVSGSSSISSFPYCNAEYAKSASETSSAKDYSLAWLSSEYSFKGTKEVSFVIKISPEMNSSSNLVLFYRSLSSSSGEYFRDPVDNQLNFSLETSGKKSCLADSYNISFKTSSCGGFSQSCCSSRLSEDGSIDSCDEGLQCNDNTCSYPTSCGSTYTYCSDNKICCKQATGSKECTSVDSCATPAQCTPSCSSGGSNTLYCDSSDDEVSPVCKTTECGKASQKCCGNYQCSSGLLCDKATNLCGICGSLSEQCCSYTPESLTSACVSTNLQCTYANLCSQPTYCGSQENLCGGATACCSDETFLGQCVSYSDCSSPVSCSNCKPYEYCDASSLSAPNCKTCTSERCEFGQLGGLCSRELKCSGGAICSYFADNNQFGKCTECGKQNTPCCSKNTCSDKGLVCFSGTCISGDTSCSSDACVTTTFSQPQYCLGTEVSSQCTLKTGSAGFTVHSLKNCDSDRCDDGNLAINYSVSIVNKKNKKLPATLKLDFSPDDHKYLVPVSVVSSKGVSRSLSASEDGSISLSISDDSWLKGSIIVEPMNYIPKLNLNLSYSNKDAKNSTDMVSWVVISNSTPPKTPSELPDLFACKQLDLELKQYPREFRVESSCDKIVMQIDSIFPADAIPLNLTGFEQYGGCSEPEFKYYDDKGQELNLIRYCFNTDFSPGGRALRYSAAYPGCPLPPVGNSVPGINMTINVSCTGAFTRSINLEIVNASLANGANAIDASVIGYKDDIAGTFVHPFSYFLYDDEKYSPLRLAYVLNNRVFKVDEDLLYAGNYEQVANIADASKFSGGKLLNPHEDYANTAQTNVALIAWDTSADPSLDIYSIPETTADSSDTPKSTIKITSKKILDTSMTAMISRAALDVEKANEIKSDYEVCVGSCKKKTGTKTCSELSKPTCTEQVVNSEKYKQFFCSKSVDGCKLITDSMTYGEVDDNDVETPKTYEFERCSNECYQCSSIVVSSPEEKPDKAKCDEDTKSFANCAIPCYSTFELDTYKYFSEVYPKAVMNEFRKFATETAKKTAFKRSFVNSIYCTSESPTLEQITDETICKNTLESWKTTVAESESIEQKCTFCYDEYAKTYGEPSTAEAVDSCDSRCKSYSSDSGCLAVSSSGYCVKAKNGESYTNPNAETFTCDSENSCVYACASQNDYQGGDACKDSALCGFCTPKGTLTVESAKSYSFVWLNTSEIFEVQQEVTDLSALEAQAPFKYFNEDINANPFVFSMVLQERAPAIFNKYEKFKGDYKNDADSKTFPEQCKVREGIYLLQSKTADGLTWDYNSETQTKFHVEPLYLTNRVPIPENLNFAKGNCAEKKDEKQVACNLFDPYGLHDKFGDDIDKNLYPAKKITESCFAFEWPIVPDFMLGPSNQYGYHYLGYSEQYSGDKNGKKEFRSTSDKLRDFALSAPQDTKLEDAYVGRFLGYDGRYCVAMRGGFSFCLILKMFREVVRIIDQFDFLDIYDFIIQSFYGLFDISDNGSDMSQTLATNNLAADPLTLARAASRSDLFSAVVNNMQTNIESNSQTCCGEYKTWNLFAAFPPYDVKKYPDVFAFNILDCDSEDNCDVDYKKLTIETTSWDPTWAIAKKEADG